MEVFRQALAFPMLATAIWLVWVLGGQVGIDGTAIGLVAILLLSLAAWAYGRASMAEKTVGWKIAAATAIMLLTGSIASFARLAPGLTPGPHSSSDTLFEETAYSPEALEALLESGDPVFAYFTADWCITCKVNERVAIKTPATAAFFQEKGIRVLVGDWTNGNPHITAILTEYDRAGVPMYLYFAPGASFSEGRLLPQLLTPATLRNAIANPDG